MSVSPESVVDGYYIRKRGRVSGPFSTARLKAMFSSGQFGRFHEVSPDKVTWMAASVLEDIFISNNADRDRGQNNAIAPVDDGPGPVPTALPVDNTEWYYALDGEQHGPLTTRALRELVRAETLVAADLVWHDGFDDWQTIGSRPELIGQRSEPTASHDATPILGDTSVGQLRNKSRSNATMYAFAAVGIVVLISLFPLISILKSNQSPSTEVSLADGAKGMPVLPNTSNPFTMSASGGAVIQSVSDEDTISKAVGLVICGVSVVGKDGEQREFPFGSGTCFVVSSDGYALTNKHVIEQPRILADKIKAELKIVSEFKVWTSFEDEPREASIVYIDNDNDFAILKVDGAGRDYFRLSSNEDPRRGTKVFALGFPGDAQRPLSNEEEVKQTLNKVKSHTISEWVGNQDFQYTQTNGTVSRMKREVTITLIQHNSDINHGNSGGPLVTDDGHVVGINTFGIPGAAGVFYALPVGHFRETIDRYDIEATWME